MGRITVFTGNDVNSLSVLKALKQRQLPYSEISVDANPSRSEDARSLSGKSSLPRVFFNTRPVGGVNDTMKELLQWDYSSAYQSPLEKFQAEVAPLADPINPLLSPIKEDTAETPVTSDESESGSSSLSSSNDSNHISLAGSTSSSRSTSVHNHAEKALRTFQLLTLPQLHLFDGTLTSYHDITEKLQNSLEIDEATIKGVVYKKTFTGTHAIRVFQSSMNLTKVRALHLFNQLLQAGVFHALPRDTQLVSLPEFTADGVYRLQCHETPHIVNTYALWNTSPQVAPTEMVAALDEAIRQIERDSVADTGLLDCAAAMGHEELPRLEEMVGSLQTVDFASLPSEEKMPFALNVYNILLRYTFIKIGIPIYDADRSHFLNNVHFMIGSESFSFQEWLDGVILGKNNVFGKKKNDTRSRFVIDKTIVNNIASAMETNPRGFRKIVRYALNAGPHVGTRTSVPFRVYKARNIHKQLHLAAVVFWEDESSVDISSSSGTVKIPLTLRDKFEDFASGSMLESLGDYLSVDQKGALREIRGSPRIVYNEANWARNYFKFARYDREALVNQAKGIKALIRRFRPPTLPDNEVIRRKTVRSLNLLDAVPEERFDRITKMAQLEFAVPIVHFTLIDDESTTIVKSGQWGGLLPPDQAPTMLPRETSFCGHVILEDNGMMVVEDTQQDDRFADNPQVDAFGLRFYAGACITAVADSENMENEATENSPVRIGTMCLYDIKPRSFSSKQRARLQHYAQELSREVVLRREEEQRQLNLRRQMEKAATNTPKAKKDLAKLPYNMTFL